MLKARMRFGDLLKRLVLGLILGSAAVVFGSRYYVEHRVTSYLDQIAQAAVLAETGDLRYLKVYSTFEGQIGVEGIGFYPPGDADEAPIIVDELVISTPGYLYLLGLQGDAWPRTMQVELKGLRVDSSAYFNLGPGTEGSSISGNPFESLACGNVDSFRSPDLAAMGLQGAERVNLSISYNMLTDNSVTLSLRQNTANVSIVTLLLNFNAEGLHAKKIGQLPEKIELKSGNLTIKAGSFSNVRNGYCADLTGRNVEQFVNANIEAALAVLQHNSLQPLPEMIEQYRAFMLGSDWTLESKPGDPLVIADLRDLESSLLLDRLALRSKLQGQQHSSFGFTVIAALIEQDDNATGYSTPLIDPVTGLMPSMVRLRNTSDRLVEVPLSEIGLYIDTVLTIRSTSRQEYIGLLIAVEEGGLRINTNYQSGNANVLLPIDQISMVRLHQSVIKRIKQAQQ